MSVPESTIAPSATLAEAREMMVGAEIRHLPVIDQGRCVGMLSQGDLYAAEAFLAADPDQTLVEQAMAQDLYRVGPQTPLAEVAKTMVERRIGSVLVEENGRLKGLFTNTDACKMLATVLEVG